MANLIAIEYEGIEAGPHGPPKVSEKAFKLIWEPKGWTKIEGSDQEPPELVLPDGSLDQQILKAQKALEEGRLTPTPEGEQPVLVATTKPTEQAPAESVASTEVSPVENPEPVEVSPTEVAKPAKVAARGRTTATQEG